MNSFRCGICVKALAGPVYFDPKSYRGRRARLSPFFSITACGPGKICGPTPQGSAILVHSMNTYVHPVGGETTSKEHLRRAFSSLVRRI
jgi:hypothetical protein